MSWQPAGDMQPLQGGSERTPESVYGSVKRTRKTITKHSTTLGVLVGLAIAIGLAAGGMAIHLMRQDYVEKGTNAYFTSVSAKSVRIDGTLVDNNKYKGASSVTAVPAPATSTDLASSANITYAAHLGGHFNASGTVQVKDDVKVNGTVYTRGLKVFGVLDAVNGVAGATSLLLGNATIYSQFINNEYNMKDTDAFATIRSDGATGNATVLTLPSWVYGKVLFITCEDSDGCEIAKGGADYINGGTSNVALADAGYAIVIGTQKSGGDRGWNTIS